MKKLYIILFLIFSQTYLNADMPHYLDFKFILNESNAGKKAQNSLKSKLAKGINSVKAKEKSIQEEEKKVIQQKKLIKPEEYKKKVDELRKKVAELQKNRSNALGKISKQRARAKNELLKNLEPIIQKYMQDKKIRMVLNKKDLIQADNKLDITKDIMVLLNEKIKSVKLD